MQQLVERYTKGNAEVNVSEKTLLSRLVKLYEEAESRYTRQQILFTFVKCHSKTELLQLIPGLTKWRIDVARRHASLVGPGRAVELPAANCIHRCRMDPITCQNIFTPPNPENMRPHYGNSIENATSLESIQS